ncbi:MAG: hypothetical protein FJX74_15410, partial [Armatimonadetes bacterium]|nr:hypothetical protein [Armatimonadota bacterium]
MIRRLPMLVALLGAAFPAPAQDYRFSVPEMLLDVYVNPDASVTLHYTVTFQCSPMARPIDIVDVGLPDRDYDIGNMTASINDVPLSGIRKSTAIDCGVEVPLGAGAIAPGQAGIFHFKATMPSRVYQDTTREDYASLWITPTWWGAQYVEGTGNIGVVVYLPGAIQPDEVLHQGQEFTVKAKKDSHTIAAWLLQGVRADGPRIFRLSFPKRVMDRVVKQTVWDLLMKWWLENPQVRIGWAIALFILYGIAFFRASKGTGVSLFILLVVGLSVCFVLWPVIELFALPLLIPIWFLAEKGLKRRRGHYLPAIASVEGGGVKRGLSAAEAAILLEMPLGRVLTLIVFGLLKKGIVKQLEPDPLEVQLAPEFANLTRKERQAAARRLGTVIHAYEQPFLDEIEAHPGHPLNRIDFSGPMKHAVTQAAKRVKGFDLEQTRSYYRYIISRAWAEAKAIGDVEKRTEYADDNLLWLLTAQNGYDSFDSWHSSGYHYDPPWGRGTTMGPGLPTPQPSAGGRTSFTDVSRSFAGWAEGITGGLAGKMDPVSVGLKGGGLVDLSGVDKVTVDVLESLAESSGSGGGGGGGGGGCACAGCACACACAGGGR